MALTTAQIAIFKTALFAETDSELVSLRDLGATQAIANWYNQAGSFIIWKTNLTESDIVSQVSPEATVWDWTSYIATSVAEKMAWERIFNGTFDINPSLQQVRDGIAEIFSGPQGATQRAHLLAMGKRPASKVEEIFATGTGTTATPGLLTFEGTINNVDVAKALL